MLNHWVLWMLSLPLLLVVQAVLFLFLPNPKWAWTVLKGNHVYASLVAVVSAVLIFISGSQHVSFINYFGVGWSLKLDMLALIIFSMVVILGQFLLQFSKRYLDGDATQMAFMSRLCLTIASVLCLVTSGNLLSFWVFWVCTSLALHQLLLIYPERHSAQVAARKKFILARFGDVFLGVAFVLLYHLCGTADMSDIFKQLSSSPVLSTQLEWVGVCVAIAAVLKAAQFPTHGWLIEVMESPTPVSALLHAGVLNAGPFLVLRFAHLFELTHLGPYLLILMGGFTAFFASTALLTQSSIKVILGYSSAAHMGFMLFLCGIGAYSAATLHLVAHSFYKAHAFLSSGSAVDVARAYRVALPKRFFKISRLILSLLLALLVYAVLLFLFSVGHYFEPVYVLMGLILLMGLTQLIAPALDSSGSVFAIGITAGLATLVAMSFLTLEKLAHYLLYASFPTHGHITPVALTIFICILVLFALVIVIQILKPLPGKTLFRRRLYVAFKNGFYANALFNRIIDANAQKNGGVG